MLRPGLLAELQASAAHLMALLLYASLRAELRTASLKGLSREAVRSLARRDAYSMRAPRGSEQRLVLARLAKLQVPTCQHTPSCCSGGERGAQGYPQVVGGPLLLAPGGALTANSPRAVRSGQTRRLS